MTLEQKQPEGKEIDRVDVYNLSKYTRLQGLKI